MVRLPDFDETFDRRRFLGWTAGLAVASVVPGWVGSALALPADDGQRWLTLFNVHTGETFERIYYQGGRYRLQALREVNELFRDHRTGQSMRIDPRLLDFLHSVARRAGVEPRYQLVSGFRTPRTNVRLRRTMEGVARRSYHLQGRAADVRLDGVRVNDLGSAARSLELGGVGTYAGNGFVHLDTGPFRTW